MEYLIIFNDILNINFCLMHSLSCFSFLFFFSSLHPLYDHGKGKPLLSPDSLRQGRPLIPAARGKPVFNSLLFGTPSKVQLYYNHP